MYRVPVATYRIQFNADFRFEDAHRIAEYLGQLGVSELYASPLLRPRTGSTHGYDIVDATSLNPQLGTVEDFNALHEELRRNHLGLLLDIVPNHMAASHENAWWMSVLENGAQSRYLHYFDIDWRDNKVLLPILGRPYGEALESGELKLGFDQDGFFIMYYDKRLPVAPQSYKIVLRESMGALPAEGPAIEVRDIVSSDDAIANSRYLKETLWRVRDQSPDFREALDAAIERFNSEPDLLDQLLSAQAYRLAYWRIASETINYRRFFDVTDLVGIRVENPEVFETRNELILELIGEGKLTGVRIDHIDGLFDPVNYLTKLQVRLGGVANDDEEKFYVVVEKILEHGEDLPRSFRCAGTTGYDFLDTANAVFVDPAGLGKLTELYQSFTGITQSYEDLVYERKKQVVDQLFYGEMRALGSHLASLAVCDRNARDFAPSEIITALIEVTACMPVYRTYIREGRVTGEDRGYIEHAVSEARRRAANIESRIFDFVHNVLLLQVPKYISGERDKWLEFVMRWQQFTGRVMAKGVEDTAFYNYNRLISLNEVGGEPGRGSEFDPVAELHARNERVARTWPHTINATSTHDTKRSEDVRARISVLSEIPDVWSEQVEQWARANASLKKSDAPDSNEELMIYQTLVGMWPLEESELSGVPDRLRAFLEKAAREAKTHSSWLAPNEAYEKALQDFAVAAIENREFMAAFRPLQERVAFHGMLNSLAQVVLKATSPGTPDFYQGSEMWDFSLVDPDNRRPVDYKRRMSALRDLPAPDALMRDWRDGRIKLFVTARTLAARARNIETFLGSEYRAVETGTPHAVAFTRGESVLVVVPRLTTRLTDAGTFPLRDVWGNQMLSVGGRWRNAFTEETVEGERLALRDVFAGFPVAILERA